MHKYDIVGKTYGKLFVESKSTKKHSSGTFYYKCICQCKAKSIVYATKNNLTSGHTTSCGCTRKGIHTEDLLNQTFGKLTVKYKHSVDKHRHAKWYCECECGGNTIASTHSLKSGNTTSCGCNCSNQKAIEADKVFGTSLGIIKSNHINTRNKSGYKGVSWDKRKNKWRAVICFQGKYYHLLYTDDINLAIQAREIAVKKIFGNFLEWYEQYKKGEPNKHE